VFAGLPRSRYRGAGVHAQPGNGAGIVGRAEYRRAGDQSVRAGIHGLPRIRAVLATVDLDPGVEAASVAQAPQLADLWQHLGQEGLAAKAGVDRHHQDDVAQVEDLFDERDRTGRVEDRPGLLAERADARQHAVQVNGRRRLALDEQVVGAGAGDVFQQALRLDDHQVNVEGLGSRPPHGLNHDRAEADVRDEAPIHDVHMDPVGAGRVNGAHLFGEATKIGGEDRRRDDEWLHVDLVACKLPSCDDRRRCLPRTIRRLAAGMESRTVRH